LSERMTTAPRSGGRTTEQVGKSRRKPGGTTTGSTAAGTTTAGTTTGGGARGARHYPTVGAIQGSAALKLNAEQQRDPITTPRLRVAPPAPINAPRAPFIALVVAVVVAGVLGILLINTKTAENSFRIDTLQKQQAKLDSQQQDLENEIAANNSPGSLDAAARRLGLVKADNPAYIRLPDGKVFGVPKPGSGEVAVTAQESATSATGR
jgi:hypothetical protein